VLRANDSISFDSSRPHRLAAVGRRPAIAVWTVINRRDDARLDGARDGSTPS
jgi:hypothetical protein